jgi:hypothetical protein
MKLPFLSTLSLFLTVTRLSAVAAEVSDLNRAVNYFLSKMHEDGFFVSAVEDFYLVEGGAQGSCLSGDLVSADTADDSLKSVLENKKVTIALSTAGASIPTYYTTVGDMPYDLFEGSLDGYEIASQIECFRRMTEAYGLDGEIEIEHILVPPNDDGVFFEPLLAALETDMVDLVWSTMVVNADRSALVDFTTCPTYLDQMVIGAGPGIASDLPTEGGPFPVGCVAVFCTANLTEPMVLEELGPNDGLASLYAKLPNATDGIDYILGNRNPLNRYIVDNCPNCTITNSDLQFFVIQAPAFKKMSSNNTTVTTPPSDGGYSTTVPAPAPPPSAATRSMTGVVRMALGAFLLLAVTL